MNTSASSSPFRPGYGRQPLYFGGHQDVIDELGDVFDTYDFGENQSILISGLRGAGKTSMLGVLQDRAREAGWITIRDNASSGLMNRIMNTAIPTLINGLDRDVRLRLTKLNIWHFGAELEYAGPKRDVKPLLRNDLLALSRGTDNRGVLILIDEVSSGKTRLRELSELAREIAHALEDDVNIVVVFAGIKVDLDELLKQPHTTFLRRSKELDFRRLSPHETRSVFQETIRIGGRDISRDAENRLISISQGYPYLIQLAGDYAWRNSPAAFPISEVDAEAAHSKAVRAIERRVISRVYLDLSEKDRAFLHAMAVDESGRTKVADIAQRMDVSPQYVQVYKQRLIDSGYVQRDGHGYVTFSLPYLGDYVRSTLGEDDPGSPQTEDWSQFPPTAP